MPLTSAEASKIKSGKVIRPGVIEMFGNVKVKKTVKRK